MDNLDLPIALRRTRRSIGVSESCPDASGPRVSAAKTPRRGVKKRVRISDPGLSSGLTPMIRRVAVNTPKRRHSSAPVGNNNVSSSSAVPLSGELTFLPLRQVLDGRIQRRIRRNGLSEEMNTIQQEKRKRAQETKAEIVRLKAEVKARDREIYELQNATIIMDTDRVWDLEQQVEDLKDELAKKSAAQSAQSDQSRGYNWTLSGRDPFAADDFIDMLADEEEFGDETVAQLACSTPSRARSSFPTPPATSPPIPGTPCFRASRSAPTPQSHAAVQASFPDPKQHELEAEVGSLHREVDKLADTLDSYKLISDRLLKNISENAPELSKRPSASDTPLEDVETLVQRLLRTMSDRTCALDQLKSAIGDLGFAGNDASEMIISLTSGFRAARLELEYLTPGEITLPLTSRGAEVLDLMLTRLRAMAKRAKEDEDSIDEYHQIELSLRKQLDARVSVMDGLKAEMSKAEKLISEKIARIKELEVANERLKGAVDGYVRDITELEKLIQQMEQDHRDSNATHHAQVESNRRVLCKKEDVIAELETKLTSALQRTADLQTQMTELQEAKSNEVTGLHHKHGHDLAVRDARVVELRGEIDRVNESLRIAHETVLTLRVENGSLQTEMDGERSNAKAVIESMKAELQRLLQMSQDFLNSPRKRPRSDDEPEEKESDTPRGSPPTKTVAGQNYFAGGLTQGRSQKRRRGYDSGMGLLDEDEVEMF
ncbi:hypothetical protein B0T10DRAFT_474938 [Thelonectria olida]|uniref:Uncharacterized protein n=1 Tax=Thelonectria olida TaxID=1576542 RepID=A0A9P8WEA5_9HYPO|nr:hypothetical protein B0T10DRAFT_474938 [Thelonectria olida]